MMPYCSLPDYIISSDMRDVTDMNEEHKNALIASLHDICQDLDAEDVLPYLRSKGTIKEGQAQDILKKTRKSTQNMQLVDFVKGAGSSAFQEFINVLHICNVKHLAAKILAHLPSSSTQQEISSEMSTGDILDTLVGFNNYQSYSVNSSVQATSSAETTSNDSNSGVQCRDLLGRIHSNHAAQRDIIINNYNGADGQHQSSSTSSSWSSQPTTEGWLQKLKR
uniref:CARD domain-containing protein n=1 Tax=Plectus sambesii TaxID=2011161 RepID=A0A914WLH3_9BILA